MSAFLCDTDHLSAVVNAVRLTSHMSQMVESYLTQGAMQSVQTGDNSPLEALYLDLLQANLDSLGARYPDTTRGDWADEVTARLNPKAKYASVVAAIKGVQCYQYQACEHAGWKDSTAHKFTKELIGELICALPGYNEAAWGYEPDASRFTRGA